MYSTIIVIVLEVEGAWICGGGGGGGGEGGHIMTRTPLTLKSVPTYPGGGPISGWGGPPGGRGPPGTIEKNNNNK